MQQTLFALVALMVLTFLSFNQQQSFMRVQGEMVDMEMEVMASGVALQVMEYIARKDYDEVTKDGNRIDNVNALTAASSFGAGGMPCKVYPFSEDKSAYGDCDDLNDFHDMPLEPVPFILQDDTLYFNVTVQIQYLNAAGEPTTSKSFEKRATVRVRNTGDTQFMKHPIWLSRTFSYQKMKRTL